MTIGRRLPIGTLGYAAFVAVQEALIRAEFAGQRIRRRATERFALRLPRLLKTRLRSIDASPGAHRPPVSALPGAPSAPAVPRGAGGSSVDAGTLRVNLRILETLAASVREAGARLVVVDAVEYHNGAQALSDTLRRFCAERGLGYLALLPRQAGPAPSRSGLTARHRVVTGVPRTARVVAQAKVNLALRILAREESGYHQLETLFCRLALGDDVEVTLTDAERSLECDGLIPSGGGTRESNLAGAPRRPRRAQPDGRTASPFGYQRNKLVRNSANSPRRDIKIIHLFKMRGDILVAHPKAIEP